MIVITDHRNDGLKSFSLLPVHIEIDSKYYDKKGIGMIYDII